MSLLFHHGFFESATFKCYSDNIPVDSGKQDFYQQTHESGIPTKSSGVKES